MVVGQNKKQENNSRLSRKIIWQDYIRLSCGFPQHHGKQTKNGTRIYCFRCILWILCYIIVLVKSIGFLIYKKKSQMNTLSSKSACLCQTLGHYAQPSKTAPNMKGQSKTHKKWKDCYLLQLRGKLGATFSVCLPDDAFNFDSVFFFSARLCFLRRWKTQNVP